MQDRKLLVVPYVDIFSTGGGMVTSIRRLLKNLSAMGWKGVVISELWDSRHLGNDRLYGFEVEFATPQTEVWVPLKKPYKLLQFWAKSIRRASLMARAVRKEGIKLVYVTGPPSFPLTGHPNNITSWMMLKRFGGIRVVIGVRGASTTWLSSPVLGRIFHWEEAAQLAAADRFACVDHYILDENFPESFREKGRVITNSVETDVFRPMPGLEDGKKVLFAGHLTEERGIWVFMEAARLLKDKGYRFVAVGKGALEEDVRKLIEKHGLDVELPGAVPHEKIAETYNGAAVVVNPTPAEGIGNITLEAMACGKCVIRTRSKTKNYAIEDGKNGLLFDRNDAKSLAEKIEYAMEHPIERKRMGDEALKTIISEYSEKAEAEKFDRLFREMLG